MSDDFIPSTPHDQPINFTDSELQLFLDVDDVVAKSVVAGDPALIMQYGKTIIRNGLASGLALAKLMFELSVNWSLFKTAGFDGTAEEHVITNWGYSGQTFQKYVNMWENIFQNKDVSDVTKKLLMGRPIGDLLLLTAAVREGQISDEGLEKAALVPDRATLREIIRGERGKQTSSSTAIRIKLIGEGDKEYAPNTLIAYRDGEEVVIGYFVPDAGELATKAQMRIINGAHIQEPYVS